MSITRLFSTLQPFASSSKEQTANNNNNNSIPNNLIFHFCSNYCHQAASGGPNGSKRAREESKLYCFRLLVGVKVVNVASQNSTPSEYGESG